MEERVNYTMVGAFIVIMSIALLGIAYWLSMGRHTKVYDTYLVYMKEPVSGLSKMAPVKYNGVVVGFVRTIALDEDNPQLVSLQLSIEHSAPITQSTVATLRPQGITGMTYIGLKTKTAKAPRIKAIGGDLWLTDSRTTKSSL